MKALLTFIGNHDPFADGKAQLGPILSILEKRKFDKLYLLFNNDRYWDAVFKTQEICNQKYPQMKVEMRLTEAVNPINYNLVYPAMYNVVQRIVKENKGMKYTISITSGTPTMHSCWILLVQGGVINAEILQVSRENGIEKVTFDLDDFPNIAETPETKVELTRLARENAELKKFLNPEYSIHNGFYIPPEGLKLDNEIVPAYYIGALKATKGNATKAAKLLGLEPHTLRKRLRGLGINIADYKE